MASEILATNASWLPPLAACRGNAVGKFVDEVKPVMYASLEVSSTIGFVEVPVVVLLSFAVPPR